ncbi:hypothetical protein KP509_34G053800 [Ceratopteris richardii]|uniref:PB1 domain-containing protein n=2 Tax=Ceratopteris richardii TaxID=49495 RepID=A0A8T2QL83_CERRI|nr:hypothetical protein KP509_34G053800 [Ceratopteris richardii]
MRRYGLARNHLNQEPRQAMIASDASMAFVIKAFQPVRVKFQDSLRRLTVEKQQDGILDLTFSNLIGRIRNMFRISQDERIVLTYVDQDSDLVTIGDDHDLYDACVIQKINPLRIQVNVINTRIHDLGQTMDKFSSATISKSYPYLVPGSRSHFTDLLVKDVNSFSGNLCRMETLPPEVQHGGDSFRPSVQRPSEACSLDRFSKRALRSSYRKQDCDACCNSFTEGSPSQWSDQIFSMCRHDHRMAKGGWRKSNIGKLDARFVQDVTIFEGTELSPGTRFTKIWRMRNIGNLPWPPATQIVYAGGDPLGTKLSASVELPEGGLPCEEEVNIAVDFVAPVSLGRYVSHWRLRAPSGQKFGQKVWVLIVVGSRTLPWPSKEGMSK